MFRTIFRSPQWKNAWKQAFGKFVEKVENPVEIFNDAIDAIQKTRNRIDENNKKLEIMIQQNKKKQDIQKLENLII